MRIISSSANDNFKLWKSLLSSKGIKTEKSFFLSGEKLIKEYLSDENALKKFPLYTEIVPKGGSRLTSCNQVYELPNELFKELDEIGTKFNLLLLNYSPFENWDPNSAPDGLEIICPLGDPSNLGAMTRSAVAFGASKIILTEESANPFLPKSVKASAGAILKMALLKGPKLSQVPDDVIALDQRGVSIQQFAWPKNVRLLTGEEGPGIRNFKAKTVLSIPVHNVESLNAMVATSLAMYEYARGR